MTNLAQCPYAQLYTTDTVPSFSERGVHFSTVDLHTDLHTDLHDDGITPNLSHTIIRTLSRDLCRGRHRILSLYLLLFVRFILTSHVCYIGL